MSGREESPGRDGARWARWRTRGACLAAGALPVLTFPRPGLAWLAWVVLVPGILLMRSAPTTRRAAVRGWWFGAGYLLAALYWMTPNIGPGLLLVALVFGALWAGWGAVARSVNSLLAVVVLPSVWVAGEYVRSLPRLGGPWALLGASQWSHPEVLSLAAVGGVWLVTFVIVAVNTALALALLGPRRRLPPLVLAGALLVAGPATFALRPPPPAEGSLRVALVQPGVVHDPGARLAASERITAGLPRVDLTVWGESSVGYALTVRKDVAARLQGLASRNPLLVNEDARDPTGRVSKSAILLRPDGTRAYYVKTRLVPFGEYIPFRSALGWLTRISKAAGQDRVPGTGPVIMYAESPVRPGHPGRGVTMGPLICFESAFPDLGRDVARRGAQVLVYQSSTSTFQGSWAPAQHASLAAVRAAENGRPAVQAALTGVSVGFDAQGRRLAWMDTGRTGSTVLTLRPSPPGFRTPYDRYGDYVVDFALIVTAAVALASIRRSGNGSGGRAEPGPGAERGRAERGPVETGPADRGHG
ncbi:apolipoprotein N-acyltransferase [Actinomadura viridis]|uniref:apolipoprotein N-acyltransferase n=1 Tax=Actinomadura viridis TaxID=58110 RepID=UPI0036C2B920